MKKILFLSACLMTMMCATACDENGEQSHQVPFSIHIKGFALGVLTGSVAPFVDKKFCGVQHPPIFSFVVEPIGRRIIINTIQMPEQHKKTFYRSAQIGSWLSFFIVHGYHVRQGRGY